MKHIVRKPYWDYEKEESWLNQMSSMGLALVDYSWCRYVFEPAQPNEYVYRVELLEKFYNHPDSMAYIRFLEENGIECVATYRRWIYIRKRSADGSFENYTDNNSKLMYLKRVHAFWNSFVWLELFAGVLNILIGFINGTTLNIVLGFLCSGLGLGFLKMNYYTGRKIRKLEQQKIIKE